MSSSSANPSSAVERGAPLGQLYLIPISAWSHRVLLTLKHARANVNVRESIPMLSEFMIWVRLGFPRRKITFPVLFRHGNECLMDSHAIARVLDAARAPGAPSLFPEAEDSLLRRLVAHAETVQAFARGEVGRYLQDHPDVAKRLILPPVMQNMPFALSIAKNAIRKFNAKYDEESSEATVERAREALVEVNTAVKNAKEVDGVRYIVGERLSYADFVVAMALPFVDNQASPFNEIPKHPIGDEFPELKAYAAVILEKHITTADVAFPPPKYDSVGKTI